MPVPLIDTVIPYAQVARPAPIWRGVTTVVWHCENDSAAICHEVANRARIGAPLRIVEEAAEPFSVNTLRVVVAIGPKEGPMSLMFAADRPVSMDDAQGSLLPRRFVADAGEGWTHFLDRALNAFLPWRGERRAWRMIQKPDGETIR